MARQTDILTPDNVTVRYELAGLGSRFLGLFVDILVQGLLTVALITVFSVAGKVMGWVGMFDELTWSWGSAVFILLLFLIWWIYFPLFETIWNGQTPGKRVAGTRVLRDGGFPLDFRGALIRNLVRVADFFPGLYGIGCAFILFHPQCKRLGDLAAGTIVVRERHEEPAAANGLAHLPGARVTRGLILDSAESLDLSMAPLQALTREQLQAVKHYLERRPTLDYATQETIAARIAQPLLTTLGLTPEDIGHHYNEFLSEVVETYERRQATKMDF